MPVEDAWRLVLLNGLGVTHSTGPTVALPPVAQRMVAFLALRDRPPTRGRVASALWDDLSEERASANLRSTLWRLRRQGCPIVEATGEQLQLSPAVAIDVHEMVDLAHEILNGWIPPAVWRAIEPLRGELLPEWDEEWVLLERERLRHLRLHALEALSDRLATAGRLPEAVHVAVAAVAIDPLRESARRALMRAHLVEGNVGEAYRQYEEFRSLLRDELGLDPTHLMQDLIRQTWAS